MRALFLFLLSISLISCNTNKDVDNSLYKKGVSFGQKSQIDSSSYYLNKALEYYYSIDYEPGKMMVYNAYGQLSYDAGHYEVAKNFYNDALKIGLELDSMNWLQHIRLNLGKSYFALGDYKRAYEQNVHVMNISEKHFMDTVLSIGAMNNIGTIYNETGKHDEALLYLSDALERANRIKNETYLNDIYHNLGVCYSKRGNQDSAEYYFTKSITLNYERDQLVRYLNNLTELIRIGAMDEYPERYLSLAKEHDNPFIMSHIFYNLFKDCTDYYTKKKYLNLTIQNLIKAKQYNDLRITVLEGANMYFDFGYPLLAKELIKKYEVYYKRENYKVEDVDTSITSKIGLFYKVKLLESSIEKDISKNNYLKVKNALLVVIALLLIGLMINLYLISKKNKTIENLDNKVLSHFTGR